MAKGQTCSPSASERLAPKKRVMKETRMSGIRVPAMACRMATFNPMNARKSVHSAYPASAANATISGLVPDPGRY